MSRGEGGGAPEGNGNNVKHNLFSDRDKLYQRLDKDEQRLVTQIASDLLDRLGGEIGAYEREAVRNIAIDTIKRTHFNEYEGTFNPEKQNVHEAYSRIRRDNIKEMKEMGLNVQSPDAKEAEAKSNWFDAIEDAEDSNSGTEEESSGHRGYDPDAYDEVEMCPVEGCTFADGNMYKHYDNTHPERDYEEFEDE